MILSHAGGFGPPSLDSDDLARERGRQLALSAMFENPDKQREVEGAFGVDWCRRRYPELYWTGFRRGISGAIHKLVATLPRFG